VYYINPTLNLQMSPLESLRAVLPIQMGSAPPNWNAKSCKIAVRKNRPIV